MLMRRIIPCLDVCSGRVVKGIQFSNLRDAGDPAERARSYQDVGADEIVVLDVSATYDGREAAADTVRAVRAQLSIPLTVGGGMRTVADAARLLEAGADKVGVNSAAVTDPNLIGALAATFGRQCTVVAIDAAAAGESWCVVTHGGSRRTPIDAIEWAVEAESRGAGEILLTSWDRDGTRHGYDLALLAAVTSAVRIPVIASGGAATAEHLCEAIDAGADAVLAASIFHDNETTVRDIKQQMTELNSGIAREIRL